MPLCVRIIPTLLKRGEHLVKGRQFNAWRTVGVVEQAARICSERGVDEIILLDIDATPSGKGPDFAFIERISGNFFTPLTVGGGVRSIEHFQGLLNAGADKVAIGAAMFEEPLILADISKRYGAQALVASLDVLGGRVRIPPSGQRYPGPFPYNPVDVAKEIEQCGAGEILLTSIDREGTMEGYDLKLIEAVSNAVDIPVIAHGGCSGYPDMLAAIKAGAHAVAAGALFQFTNHTPLGAAKWLAEHGVHTRIPEKMEVPRVD